jgi:hypothetical protein
MSNALATLSSAVAVVFALGLHAADAPAQSRDGVRLRGGISLAAGPYFPTTAQGTTAYGGGLGLSARFGVQFAHPIGLYLQSHAAVGAIGTSAANGDLAGVAMAQSQNALLLSVTLAHFFELAAGPSADYTHYWGCASASLSCSTASGVAPGLHGRTSVTLGGSGAGPGRFGFNLALDVHRTFGQSDPYSGGHTSALVGLGLEWY